MGRVDAGKCCAAGDGMKVLTQDDNAGCYGDSAEDWPQAETCGECAKPGTFGHWGLCDDCEAEYEKEYPEP